MLQAQLRRFPYLFRQLSVNLTALQIPDAGNLQKRCADHFVQVGRFTVYLPVHIITHFLDDPHIFKFKQRLVRTDNRKKVDNMVPIL